MTNDDIQARVDRGSETGGGIPWGFLLLLAILATAYFTNPDTDSLKKTVQETWDKNMQDAELLEWVVGETMVEVSCQRDDYYLFSIGTIKSQLRFGGPNVEVQVIGAFGRWWFELPGSRQ